MAYDIVEGDTGTELVVTIKDQADTPVDLTGSTILFQWDDSAGTLVSKEASIVNALGGVASYQFAAGEIFHPHMQIEVKVTDSSSKVLKSKGLIDLRVRKALT